MAFALSLLLAPSAVGYSGTITRAYTSATWTRGSLAGQVNWTDCGSPCAWLPTATVQPTLPDYRCLGDEALDSDPNTLVVWNGGGRSTNGAAAFDLTGRFSTESLGNASAFQ